MNIKIIENYNEIITESVTPKSLINKIISEKYNKFGYIVLCPDKNNSNKNKQNSLQLENILKRKKYKYIKIEIEINQEDITEAKNHHNISRQRKISKYDNDSSSKHIKNRSMQNDVKSNKEIFTYFIIANIFKKSFFNIFRKKEQSTFDNLIKFGLYIIKRYKQNILFVRQPENNDNIGDYDLLQHNAYYIDNKNIIKNKFTSFHESGMNLDRIIEIVLAVDDAKILKMKSY